MCTLIVISRMVAELPHVVAVIITAFEIDIREKQLFHVCIYIYIYIYIARLCNNW